MTAGITHLLVFARGGEHAMPHAPEQERAPAIRVVRLRKTGIHQQRADFFAAPFPPHGHAVEDERAGYVAPLLAMVIDRSNAFVAARAPGLEVERDGRRRIEQIPLVRHAFFLQRRSSR